jgi:hypothetical protein
MNEFDVDKLISNSLAGSTAGDGFRQQVFRESTGALKRGVVFRRRLRTTRLTLSVLLIAAGAFFLGQFSASTSGGVAQEQQGWTSVPTELVAWLDTGRFFEQLGMRERANGAYEEASVLIPYEIWQTRLEQNKSLTAVLANVSADGSSGRPREWTDSVKATKTAEPKFGWPKKGKVIAQCLGG